MQFTEDKGFASANQIRSYEAGQITVNTLTYNQSLIIAPQALVTDWAPQTLADLTQTDLDALLALDPEVIILGVGPKLQFPNPALLAHVTQQGVGIEVMDTPAACRTYNILMAEGRKVVVGLLLT